MTLSTPLFLLSLLPAAAVLALGARAARSGGLRPRLALALRAAAALALGLAAAGLLVRAGGRPRALVVLDRSASLAGSREAAADAALACGRALSPRFDVSYASFAAAARLEAEAGLGALAPDESGSDPGAAMRLAAQELRDGEPAVVVTDGQFLVPGSWFLVNENRNQPSATRNQEPGTRNSTPSFVFLPLGPKGPDAALVELDAPAEVRPGEKFAVTARVAGSASTPVAVSLTPPPRSPIPDPRSQDVSLPAEGRAVRSCSFEETAPESGLLEYRAELSAPGDGFAGNNSARALVRVMGKLRVGCISRFAPDLLSRLEAAGFLATAMERAEPFDPAAFDAVVLDDMRRSQEPGPAAASTKHQAIDDQLAGRLAEFVRSGGGLVVLGGPEAYGAGGWEDSGTLEKELPVSMRPPDEALFVVLVLDRSGSMGQPAAAGSEESKLSLVKRAAQELLGSFRPKDRLAVVAFSEKAGVIAAPAEPADEEAARRIAGAIGGLETGSSTHLADALAEAAKLLPPPEAGGKLVRHVLLLSDGLPEGVADRAAEVRRLEEISRSLAAAGVTVSTVGTGGDSQDRELLRNIAEKWGRGSAYQPQRLSELLSVFRRDLVRGRLTAVGAFRPQPTADPLAGLLGTLPELAGRNRVTAKPGARTVLEAPPAAGLGREPVLAVWDRGRGRAACFASDFQDWNRGAAMPPELLKELVAWAAGRSGEKGCRLAARDEGLGARGEGLGGTVRLELVARDGKDEPLDGLASVVELSDLAGKWSARVELLQESPSRYAARMAPPADVREVVATARDAKTGRELARGAFPLAFPGELSRIGVDRAALAELAELVGGRVISAPGELVRMDFARATGRGIAAAAPWLALAGLLLVICELGLRAARK